MTKPTPLPHWFNQALDAAEQAQLPHIDLLFDVTNWSHPLPAAITQPESDVQLAWLLHDTPEHTIAQSGPALLRLSRLTLPDWLGPLLASPKAHQHLSALVSDWPFSSLADHLRHCTQAQWNQGKSSGLLRFYDPRLIIAIEEMLEAHQHWFYAPVHSWHWSDRDRQPRRQSGMAQPPSAMPKPLPVLELKFHQVGELIAWAEAEDYRRSWAVQPQDYGLTRQEALMRHIVHAQLAASREQLFDPDLRDAFIRRWLAAHSPVSPPPESEVLI